MRNGSLQPSSIDYKFKISYRMTIKIVVFGESDQVAKFVQKSRGGHSLQSQQAISVENITINETPFLLFAVKQRGLVSQQATGTNGLLFFLGGETPLFEEKQYLTELLASKTEFQGVPLAIIFERGHQLTLKDVVNYMELYRLKDRASMIKEIGWGEREWIDEVYGWVKSQSEQSKGKGFQAIPKVVKLKPKYRESVEEESEKKYEGMLGEKDLRSLAVKQQEEIYIDREKEKLKHENMENQLSNFSKNKKKMAPYDIKPTPNPKIQPNLHFFLKDPNAQPPPEVSIKIQTDQFKEKLPPPPYKPKKTGINTATQIQQNQLFNFDKEVKPILSILTTKALQSAALQIEQEQEFLKMAKYKTAYQQRVKKQKEHEQKNIDQELRVMKEKDKLLDAHRSRAQTIRNVQQRVQCYQIANNFLSNIYHQSVSKLITANAYADNLSNFLESDYLSEIIGKANAFHQKIVQEEVSVRGVFEKDVIGSITEVVKGPKAAREITKKRVEDRLTNKVGNKRRVHILYKHETPQISNFSKYLSKYFDGSLEEYIKNREEQLQEVSDKVHGGEATEEELHRFKSKDSVDFAAAGHQTYLLGNQKEVCFTWTSNRFEKSPESYLSTGLLFLDKEGEIVDELVFGKVHEKFSSFLRYETNLRSARENVNMDQGITINLAKVPENIKSIIVLNRFNEAQRFRAQAQAKKIKYASYGAEFWQRKVGIHQKNIGESLKWQELIKVPEGEEPVSQSVIVVGYVLRRRVIPQWWNLQDVAYTYQPIKSEEEFTHFLEELSRCYYRSGEYLKEEQEEERIERPVSQQKKTSTTRVKSKKVIQEPKKRIVLKVTTKILSEVEVDLTGPFQEVLKKFAASIEEWKEFLEICDNGWELLIKGMKLTSIDQLADFRKIGDLVLKRVPKVEEPKVEKLSEAEGEKQEVDDS